MSEYLKFQEVPKPKRKTKFVRVMSKDGETLLGEISFWPAWRNLCRWNACMVFIRSNGRICMDR